MERKHVFKYHLKLRNGQLKAAMIRQHIDFSNVNKTLAILHAADR